MPWLVNGQLVPDDLIRQEAEQIAGDPRFQIAQPGQPAYSS